MRWQRWSMRVTMDPVEGLVLHDVGYEDDGRVRSIIYRAAVSEMVVPYGDPGPMHGWKNAFDAGEWGLGRMVNSLTLGCDCLGVIHYFDAVFTTEQGKPYTIPNAICVHEEDYGMLWKHSDPRSGRTEVRRSRRLVVSSIATVGNYEYGFFWYFYLDGSIQFEVKMTGILSTMAVAPAERPRIRRHDRPPAGGAVPPAPLQHASGHGGRRTGQFRVRDGGAARGPGAGQPVVERLRIGGHVVARPSARPGGSSTPTRSRYWKVVNNGSLNRLGEPVAYKLVPGSTPTLLAAADSSVGRRAGFTTRNLWVTPYAPDERRAGGDYPNQHSGGDGLPRWTTRDRSIVDEDIVALVHVRGHAHPPTRGLAGHARGVHGLLVGPRGFLPPQPRSRRAPVARRRLSHRIEPKIGPRSAPPGAAGVRA